MENYKNTWMQKSSFFAWREKPLATQLREIGLKPAQMSQVVTFAKKQDHVPKLLLTIQFVRFSKDLKREFPWKAKRQGKKLVLQMCVAIYELSVMEVEVEGRYSQNKSGWWPLSISAGYLFSIGVADWR